MQKTLIALAVAALVASPAFAKTSVKIGGKYDAGYQFKHTANTDNSDGTSNGGKTTENLGDGSASTSRITVKATETLAPGWAAVVDLDLRFGTIEEGKTGISSNDKKALYITSPYGNLRWGVMNLAMQQFWDYEEKPYMINVKDTELVKYGISEKRSSALTNRNTEYDTPILTIGPVKTRLKFSYAIGDNRKGGTSNTDGTSSGDVYTVANTGAYGKWVKWGIGVTHRGSTSMDSPDSFFGNENYINIHPMAGLKIGMNFNIYKGKGDTVSSDGSENGLFKEKNTNFVIAYNFGKKAQIGVARSHLNDMGTNRNSGKAWMIGGTYFVTKSTWLYLGWEKDDFARNSTKIFTKYDGTKDGFASTWAKQDMTYTRIGLVKEF